MNRNLPEGVSARVFDRALADMRGIVGPAHVVSDEETLLPYRRTMSPIDAESHFASAVVQPASVEEVQELLKICSRHRIPLWPVSTGRNFGYGDALPSGRGQITLELRRMNRILDFDPELGTVLIEPGVTYHQLDEYLKAHRHPFWLDVPGPGPLVSPLSNTLERGGGQTDYGDHFANCCGLEVVLADGSVLRTGLGGVEKTTSWQAFKYGFGPYLDGLFTQSNFGVVTKMGLWLMPAPEAHRTFIVQYRADEGLETLIDTARPLAMQGIIRSYGVLFNRTVGLTSFAAKADIHAGNGAASDEILAAAADRHGLAHWNYVFTLYGRREQVDLDTKLATEAFEASGALVIPDIYDPAQIGKPSLQSFRLLNWIPGGGLAWFCPVAPSRARDVRRQMDLAKSITARHDLDFMTAASVGARSLENIMPLVFDRTDALATERANRCLTDLIAEFAKAGYGMYRTGIGFMDQVADSHGAVNREVNRRLKKALDPQGIIAPGKSGIHG